MHDAVDRVLAPLDLVDLVCQSADDAGSPLEVGVIRMGGGRLLEEVLQEERVLEHSLDRLDEHRGQIPRVRVRLDHLPALGKVARVPSVDEQFEEPSVRACLSRAVGGVGLSDARHLQREKTGFSECRETKLIEEVDAPS